MIKKRLTFIVCLLSATVSLAATAETFPAASGDYSLMRTLASGQSYGYGLHLPKKIDKFNKHPEKWKKKKIPLIVALHYGFGGESAPLDYGFGFMEWMMSPTFPNAIIVAPSALKHGWFSAEDTEALFALLDDIKEAYPVDDKRILLTGYSEGSFGTWAVGADHQDQFDAIMPISGAPKYYIQPDPYPATPEEVLAYMQTLTTVSTAWEIPVYIIHSDGDQNVPIELTESYVAELSAQNVDFTFNVIHDVAHFDVQPFLDQAKIGYDFIKDIWEMKENDCEGND